MSHSIVVKSLCRCCHSVGNFKSLSLTYFTNGVKEVFADMLCETFNLNIEPLLEDLGVDAYCICPPCAARLRDAVIFKHQVVECEEKLLSGIKVARALQENENQDSQGIEKFSVIREEYLSIKTEDSDEDPEPISKNDNVCTPQKKEKPKFSCHICQKLYINTASLEIHMKNHSGEASYLCYLCDAKFFQKKALSQHIDDNHRIDGKYACTQCDKQYEKPGILKNHVQSHLNEIYICDYCKKVYTRKKNLKEHIKLHTGNSFKCNICDKGFYEKRQLNIHMNVHSEGMKYVCELCGKQFRQECSIKRHCNKAHSGQNELYTCSICGKNFSTKSYVATHERSHYQGRPFSCSVCEKDFKELNHLKRHMKVHTGEKPYKCTYCNKRFAHLATFVIHERRHTGVKPYECTVCKKAFVGRSNLNVHLRLHTGQKPFLCEICDKRFNEKGQLLRHIRYHTGELYSCNICSKQVRSIYTHMKTKHPDQWTPQRVVVANGAQGQSGVTGYGQNDS